MANNSQVAHRWANNTDQDGHLTGSHYHFEGPCLYSYREMIGRMVTGTQGQRIAFITSEDFSHSTQRHKSLAWGALHGLPITVFHVFPNLLKYWERGQYTPEANHSAFIQGQLFDQFQAYVEQAVELTAKAKRARVYGDSLLGQAQGRLADAQAFSNAFGLGLTVPDNVITQEMAAKVEEKRKAEAARRLEAQKAQREKDRQTFEDWKAGQAPHCPYSYATDEKGSAYLRVMFKDGKQVVQTSRGAEVPFTAATKAFQFVKLCRMTGRTFQANRFAIPVGHFELRSIDAAGNVHVGCHFFTWERIKEFAEAAGIYTLEGSTDALVRASLA